MRHLLLIALIFVAPASSSEWAEAVPVGATFPAVEAADQYGKNWTNAELVGKHGLVFFFNRSTSW